MAPNNKIESPIKENNPLEEYEWSLFLYWFADCVESSNIEMGIWRDLAKLTRAAEPNNKNDDESEQQGNNSAKHVKRQSRVHVNILMDLFSSGAYEGEFDNVNQSLQLRPCTKEPNMSSDRLLTQFLSKESITTHHNKQKRRMVVFGGHGAGWLAMSESGSHLSVKKIAAALRATGGTDIVCLDACLMGCIETVVEFEGAARFITVCENYCPWNGVISPNLIREMQVVEGPEKLCTVITSNFIRMNHPTDMTAQTERGIMVNQLDKAAGVYLAHDPRIILTCDACDISAISVQDSVDLYKWLYRQGYHVDFDQLPHALIDSNWQMLYDLWTVVHAIPGISSDNIEIFESLFSVCFVSREVSPNTPTHLMGMSVARPVIHHGDTTLVNPWPSPYGNLNLSYSESLTNHTPFKTKH
jgi:hypothetical protein